MPGRSWRMNLSVQRLLGFLWLPSHLRVNERQLVASGRQSQEVKSLTNVRAGGDQAGQLHSGQQVRVRKSH